jgi:hypothetical protein
MKATSGMPAPSGRSTSDFPDKNSGSDAHRALYGLICKTIKIVDNIFFRDIVAKICSKFLSISNEGR